MSTSALTIDQFGYFSRQGQRFVPVGVNYWPGSAGVEMWVRWPEAEMQHDLDVIRSLGLNCIRFFLRWQDFEPRPGEYAETMFERLTQFLDWCREREIYAQPSLFVGWMSGGTFWPEWRRGRNLFADPEMITRSMDFARKAAEIIAPYHEYLLGIDQGNEIDCLADCRTASPAEVAAWCEGVNRAIRSVYPEALIVSGNDQGQFVGDSGWRLGGQPGLSYYSMHGYPVPPWHKVAFDGMTDPLCATLLPFYTQVTRAFGPVLLQEFGTIVTFGVEQSDQYLRAMLPAAWAAGANGFLWWCLRDIRARIHPYVKDNFEATLGLVDDQDRVKPGMEYYVEFARSLATRPAPAPAADAVGLYFPRHFYQRDEQENPGNTPDTLSSWMVMANFMLRQLGRPVRIVRGDQPLDSDLRQIVVPGAMLDILEVEALEDWANKGGQLVWHGPDPMSWAATYRRFLGARPVDYRATRPAQVDAFGDRWTLGQYARGIRMEVVPEGAEVVARDGDDLPAVLVHRVGEGAVAYSIGVPEAAMLPDAADADARARWTRWYAGMLDLVATP